MVLGAALTVAGAFLPNLRAWHMLNVDTVEELEGQYEAEGITENVGAAYANVHGLNRQSAITQFLHGEVDTLSFDARLFAHDTFFSSVTDDLNTLKSWVRRDDRVARPPIIVFWVGDASIYLECVITKISGITYDTQTVLGAVRGCSMNIELAQYVPFELESGPAPETRYHRTKSREYPELLAVREYGDPMLGVIIRHRHPQKLLFLPGDTAKLPSVDAIKNKPRVPQSNALKGLTSRKASDQRDTREDTFMALNARTYVSTLIPEDL